MSLSVVPFIQIIQYRMKKTMMTLIAAFMVVAASAQCEQGKCANCPKKKAQTECCEKQVDATTGATSQVKAEKATDKKATSDCCKNKKAKKKAAKKCKKAQATTKEAEKSCCKKES